MIHAEQRLAAAAAYVRSLGYTPAYISLYGSQNYGLAHEGSDYDFKCIVLPSLWDLVQESKPASLTVEWDGGQIDIKDVRRLAELLARMNPAYLEGMLTQHALTLEGGKPVEQMRALMPELFAQRGAGFARVCSSLFDEKRKRLCRVSPAQAQRLEKSGYDGKQAHHMYRLLLTMRTFEAGGMMQLAAPEAEIPLLTALKQGDVPLEALMEMIDSWRGELTQIEQRVRAAYGREKKGAAREIDRLAKQAVYAHCAGEKAGAPEDK